MILGLKINLVPVVTALSDKGLLLFCAQITHPVGKVEVINSDGNTQSGIEVVQLSWTVWGIDLKGFLAGAIRGLTVDARVHAVVIMVVKTVGRAGRSTG